MKKFRISKLFFVPLPPPWAPVAPPWAELRGGQKLLREGQKISRALVSFPPWAKSCGRPWFYASSFLEVQTKINVLAFHLRRPRRHFTCSVLSCLGSITEISRSDNWIVWKVLISCKTKTFSKKVAVRSSKIWKSSRSRGWSIFH